MLSFNRDLETFGEMLSHVILWSFLVNLICYSFGGVVAVVNCKKKVGGGLPYYLCLVLYGILKTFVLDLITDVLLVALYVHSGWTMHPGYAFGWGFGVSFGTIVLNFLIAFFPCYPIL